MGSSTPRWIRFWAIVNGALVALLVGAALLGDDGVARHERLDEKVRNVNALNDELSKANERLKREAYALQHDPDYVEFVIRDELGWVRDDEMIFIFESPEAEEQGDGQATSE